MSEAKTGAHRLLPDSERAQRLLAQRAAELRAGEQAEEMRGDPFLRFTCAGEAFGLPLARLDEILYPNGLRRVPGAPAHLAGVINRRGELLTVLDLAPLFSLTPGERGDDARIVVVAAGGVTAGLLVDTVEDEGRFITEELEPPFASAAVGNTAWVRGLHAGRVTLIDAEALLTDPAIQVNE